MRFARRRFLRGAGGIAVGLPFLDSLAPRPARAAGVNKRLVIWHVPEGTWLPAFFPQGGETTFALGEITKPLEPFRSDLIFVKGVSNTAGQNLSLLPHQKAMRGSLTGGGEISSIDQIVAEGIKVPTAFKSLEFGVGTRPEINHWTRMVFWKGIPLAPEPDPLAMYDRLFKDFTPAGTSPGDTVAATRLLALKKSVLDAVLGELSQVSRQVGSADRVLLETHAASIRDLETTLDRLATTVPSAACKPSKTGLTGAVLDTSNLWPESLQAQLKLMVMALQCDRTRVMTLMFGRSNLSQRYQFVIPGNSNSHHKMGHERQGPELIKIYTWYMTQLAAFIGMLKSASDGGGTTLLDNSVVLVSSEFGAGTHSWTNIPYVLAGRCGGAFKPGPTGRNLTYGGVPHNKMLTSLALAMGVEVSTVGDPKYGTGPLAGLLSS